MLLAWGALVGAGGPDGGGTAGALGPVPFAPPLAVAWLVALLAAT